MTGHRNFFEKWASYVEIFSKSRELSTDMLRYKILSKSGELSTDMIRYKILFMSGELSTDMFLSINRRHISNYPLEPKDLTRL